jgi:hypothetical protein
MVVLAIVRHLVGTEVLAAVTPVTMLAVLRGFFRVLLVIPALAVEPGAAEVGAVI